MPPGGGVIGQHQEVGFADPTHRGAGMNTFWTFFKLSHSFLNQTEPVYEAKFESFSPYPLLPALLSLAAQSVHDSSTKGSNVSFQFLFSVAFLHCHWHVKGQSCEASFTLLVYHYF